MPRGNAHQTKVHYKGKDEDFIIMAESAQAVRDWKKDKSVPLTEVVDGFKVFVTHRQGAQGVMDSAPKATLEAEFGTSKDEDVIIQILENGDVQDHHEQGRQGNKNDTKGSLMNHGPQDRM